MKDHRRSGWNTAQNVAFAVLTWLIIMQRSSTFAFHQLGSALISHPIAPNSRRKAICQGLIIGGRFSSRTSNDAWTTTHPCGFTRNSRVRPRIATPPSVTLAAHQGKAPYSTTPTSSSSSSSDTPLPQLLTSTKSSTVKQFASLLSKRKARVASNLTVVEGHRLVLDILSNPTTEHLIQHVLISEEALNHPDFGHVLREKLISNPPSQLGFRINVATDEVIAACTDTVTPQGVVATCSIPEPFNVQSQNADHDISNSNAKRSPTLFLVLDGVSDPGNVGTLIRSSLACGVSAILLLPGCVDVYSSKALRSAMGATFRIPLRTVSSTEECWELLRQCGVSKERIYAATLDTRIASRSGNDENSAIITSSPAHTDVNWTAGGANALIIGREGPGLSPEIRDAVSRGVIGSVHVPMEGGMESLNAAICGSVILFEYARQKRDVRLGVEEMSEQSMESG